MEDIAVMNSWDKGKDGSLCMACHICFCTPADRHSSVADELK